MHRDTLPTAQGGPRTMWTFFVSQLAWQSIKNALRNTKLQNIAYILPSGAQYSEPALLSGHENRVTLPIRQRVIALSAKPKQPTFEFTVLRLDPQTVTKIKHRCEFLKATTINMFRSTAFHFILILKSLFIMITVSNTSKHTSLLKTGSLWGFKILL